MRDKKDAPVLVRLLVGAGIVDSTVIGTIALIMGEKNLKKLSKEVD